MKKETKLAELYNKISAKTMVKKMPKKLIEYHEKMLFHESIGIPSIAEEIRKTRLDEFIKKIKKEDK